MQRIPLIKPYITQEIKDKVCEVLDNGYLTEGPVTKELDDNFKNYIRMQLHHRTGRQIQGTAHRHGRHRVPTNILRKHPFLPVLLHIC
jgi:hypothetical protein